MKNFGLNDLTVVSPYPPVWEEVVSAVGALDLLRQARLTETLAAALADRTLVIGTLDPTRRWGGNGLPSSSGRRSMD